MNNVTKHLEETRRLDAAATKGPWRAVPFDDVVDSEGDYLLTARRVTDEKITAHARNTILPTSEALAVAVAALEEAVGKDEGDIAAALDKIEALMGGNDESDPRLELLRQRADAAAEFTALARKGITSGAEFDRLLKRFSELDDALMEDQS